MSYARIASVRVKNGFFFSDIIGATSDIYIKMLKKKTAKQAADIIREKVA